MVRIRTGPFLPYRCRRDCVRGNSNLYESAPLSPAHFFLRSVRVTARICWTHLDQIREHKGQPSPSPPTPSRELWRQFNSVQKQIRAFITFTLAPTKFLNKMIGCNFVICIGCVRRYINRMHHLRRETKRGNLNLYKRKYVHLRRLNWRPRNFSTR